MDIADLRKSYERAELNEAASAADPLTQFDLWMQQALQAAAAGRRHAEVALLASVAVGETPLAELHPAAVAAIVSALRSVGEDAPARLFAIETAIAHGL